MIALQSPAYLQIKININIKLTYIIEGIPGFYGSKLFSLPSSWFSATKPCFYRFSDPADSNPVSDFRYRAWAYIQDENGFFTVFRVLRVSECIKVVLRDLRVYLLYILYLLY